MAQPEKQPDREWSYPILVEEIPSQGKDFKISPSDVEKKAIAKRLEIVSLEDITAKLSVSRENGHIIKVSGKFEANLTQNCVVTMEPLKQHVVDEFEAWYADHEQAIPFKRIQQEALAKREMIDLPILEENEDPEQIEDGKIDLGELVTQYLSLAVNPYPHKEGVNYENKEIARKGPVKESLRPNPFAALKNWRPKD
jgi:hypothetical protein